MINRKIYIKGLCDYARDRIGSYAVIVTEGKGKNEKYTYFSSKRLNYVHSNFASEIEGIANALAYIEGDEPIEVFTNNKPLVSILSEEKYGYDYDDLLHIYWDFARDKKIAINWIKKSDNNKWMQNADKRANELIS